MKEQNQCGGCQKGLPFNGGRHYEYNLNGGYVSELCTKDRYASPIQQEEKKCNCKNTQCNECFDDKKLCTHCFCSPEKPQGSLEVLERTRCGLCDLPYMDNVAHACDEKRKAKLAKLNAIDPQNIVLEHGDCGSSIKTYWLKYVEIQQNGIIRNEEGRFIARLVDDIDFEGEHVKGISITAPVFAPSSSDWKQTVLEAADENINQCFLEPMSHTGAKVLIEFIEKLIEAALEEEGKIIADAIEMSKQGWIDEGRAAEREEQNRIHNSGRKLYQIGYAAALEKARKVLEEIHHSALQVEMDGGNGKIHLQDYIRSIIKNGFALSSLKKK